MEQRTYKLRDFAQDISVAVKDAQSHHLDKFVGLEHYDSGEPVITRYTDTSLITSSVKEFHKNDILIARRNVYLKRAGIAFFDGLTSGDSIILRIFDDSEKRTGIPKEDAVKIIPFVLNSNDFWAYANKHADGMNSKRISKEMLYDYEFSLPSLSEIRQLYSKLWAAYNLKEAYKKLLSATDEMVKSQFIEMFKDSPKSAISDFCKVEKGTTITRNEVIEGNIPVVAGGQEPSCYHNVANRKAGVITISASGAYSGFVNYWTTQIFASDCNTIIPIDEKNTNVHFLYHGLKAIQREIYSLQKGGAQPHVYGKDIEKFLFPYPTKEEQDKFADIAQQADKSKFELRKSIEAIDAVIKSLING